MKIKYLGHSCFQLISASGTSVIADPYTKVGYELPQGLIADAVTASHAHFDHNYTQAIQTERIISALGAYQVGDIQIAGTHSWHDEKSGALRGKNIIFKYLIDGIEVCHLGDLGEDISQELIERIGFADVLLLPVGGKYTINAEQAKALADGVRAKIVIPMHFKGDGCLDISDLSVFLKQYPPELIQKNNVTELEIYKDLLPKSTKIICLERK